MWDWTKYFYVVWNTKVIKRISTKLIWWQININNFLLKKFIHYFYIQLARYCRHKNLLIDVFSKKISRENFTEKYLDTCLIFWKKKKVCNMFNLKIIVQIKYFVFKCFVKTSKKVLWSYLLVSLSGPFWTIRLPYSKRLCVVLLLIILSSLDIQYVTESHSKITRWQLIIY